MGMMSRVGLTFLLGAAVMDMSAGVLVRDGKPNASIIIDATASRAAQFAALELQYHVEKITGAKLPIIDEPSTSNVVKILVGDSQAARDARKAAEEARLAGEKAANEAARVAAEAISRVERTAREALELARLLKSAITEAATGVERKLTGK